MNFTVNGVSQDPAFYQTTMIGYYAVNTNAFSDPTMLSDVRVDLQSINPSALGGEVNVVYAVDAPNATGVQSYWGGNGNASCEAHISGQQVVMTVSATVGPNAHVGGDCLAQWTIVVPPVIPPTPPQPPIPPCTTNCGPPTPPPTCADYGLLGAYPNCEQPPPPPPCTNCVSPPPTPPDQLQSIPTMSVGGEIALGAILLLVGLVAVWVKRK